MSQKILIAPVKQGELELVSFNTTALLEQIRASLFAHISGSITCRYGLMQPLACISQFEEDKHIISLHSILNHSKTPEFVIRHILIHELIHIEISSRELREGEEDPRLKFWARQKRRKRLPEPLGPISHPAEFWEREKIVSPERERAMEWIFDELIGWLDFDQNPEGICVRKSWAKLGRLIQLVGAEKALEIRHEKGKRLE